MCWEQHAETTRGVWNAAASFLLLPPHPPALSSSEPARGHGPPLGPRSSLGFMILIISFADN